ncbi:hypothetical protein V5O48_003154 [Marasmius crinis-equi]|uniref:Uncharacterized protein n=1 Tax=Marasmius crinis-equi TaxID=585013 RepID=A0ABR3FTX5_9AGAR
MGSSYMKVQLIGVFLECLVYGVYLTVFLQTLQILRRKLVPGFVFAYLSVTTIVLFVLITMKLGLDTTIMVAGFTHQSKPLNAPTISTGTYIALTVVADIFIVYRVFAVWSRSFLAAALPSVLVIADIVGGAFLIAQTRTLEVGQGPKGGSVATWALVFYCFTLALNVLSTALITLKLYITERQTTLSSTLNLKLTAAIVIESAALYSACLVVIVVANIVGSDNVQYLVLMLMPAIIGLTFSFIIVRVGSGASDARNTSATTSTGEGRGRGSVLRFARQRTGTTDADIDEPKPDDKGMDIETQTRTRT